MEQINFLLTNRIPRRYATIFMGWFSKLENPLIRSVSIAVWRFFAVDLDVTDAKKTQFTSLHDCFIRELKPGSRQIDMRTDIVVSPCDAIIGAFGDVCDGQLFQAKGFPYSLSDLLPVPELAARYRNGRFITLRLKSTMYHRFHAPTDCHVSQVHYISGDTWNVNPIPLKRIERLYCKNERAVIDLQLPNPAQHITLVPVAAILVAGIKLHCLPDVMDLRYRGPNYLTCDGRYSKGQEMGYFQHGSTIIMFADEHFRFDPSIHEGLQIRLGQPLMHIKADPAQ